MCVPVNNEQELIQYALAIGALELTPEGRTLKSGRVSPYFFNSGLFNSGATGLKLFEAYAATAMCLESEEHQLPFDVIFGPSYKGIPLATGVALALCMTYGKDIGYAFNRKEAKDHGEGGIIVGASLAGKNVLIVDDVMTTGASSGEAIEIIRANGGNPIACIIAFDRQERGIGKLSAVQEFQSKFEIPVYAAANLSDLISLLDNSLVGDDDTSAETLEKILAYQKQYGVGFVQDV